MRRRKVESGALSVISTVFASIFLMPSGMFVVPLTASPPLTLNHIWVGICFHASGFWAAQAIVHSTSSAVTGLPSLQTAAGFSLKV